MCFITVNTFKPIKKEKLKPMTEEERAEVLNVILEETGLGNKLRWLSQYIPSNSLTQRMFIDSVQNYKFSRKGR